MSFFYEGGAAVGMDYGIYMDRTHDWLAGDGFYRARQLTGAPYEIQNGDSFYPPTLLYLLVPFALGLPAVLWWLIPIAIIAAALIHIRPPTWTWPIMAFTLLLPRAPVVLVLGNPSIWMIAAAFAGVAWAWPSALLFLKPTLAPFALIGIRQPFVVDRASGCSSSCRCPSARCGSTTGPRWSTRRTPGASSTRSASGR